MFNQTSSSKKSLLYSPVPSKTQPPLRFGSPIRNAIYTPKKALTGLTRKKSKGKKGDDTIKKSLICVFEDYESQDQKKANKREFLAREARVQKTNRLSGYLGTKQLPTGYTVSENDESGRYHKDSNYEAFSQHFHSLKSMGDSPGHESDDSFSFVEEDVAEEFSYIEEKEKKKKAKKRSKKVNFSTMFEKIGQEKEKITDEHQFEIMEQTCRKYVRAAKKISKKKFLRRMNVDESRRSLKDETVEMLKDAIRKKNSTPLKQRNENRSSYTRSFVSTNTSKKSRNELKPYTMTFHRGDKMKKENNLSTNTSDKFSSLKKLSQKDLMQLFESQISSSLQSEFQRSILEELLSRTNQESKRTSSQTLS